MLNKILDLLSFSKAPKQGTKSFKAPEVAVAQEPLTRHIVLAGQAVRYTVVRCKRRSIGMLVDVDGLRVRAPKRVSLLDIEEALQARAEWIIEQIARWALLRDTVANAFVPGGSFLLRGQRVKLQVTYSLFASLTQTEKLWQICFAPEVIADEAAVARVVCLQLQALAEQELLPRCEALLREVGKTAHVVLNDPKTQWGSCVRRRAGVYEIRLSWRLMQVSPALAYYVIAHEVAHIFEMNHSPRFWAVVAQLDPHYKRHRKLISPYSPLLGARY
ncbi:MAG: hypothetical protein RLZZ502_1440 [Pseudomonadota bacterium]|jgi:predicted metal-dependent hydrolase